MLKTVNVTGHDASCGIASNCTKCPVARAVFRVARKAGWYGVGVNHSCVDFFKDAETMQVDEEGDVMGAYDARAALPQDASERIESFDDDGYMEPFKFQLDIPALP